MKYKNFSTSNLFYLLKFQPVISSMEILELAQGEHLCGKDLYQAQYQFFKGETAALDKFKLSYKITGPSKNYISETMTFFSIIR